MTPAESKANTIITGLRHDLARIQGDGTSAANLRDEIEEKIDQLKSAITLSNGPDPDRAQHWRGKLQEIIDQFVNG